MTSRLNAHSDLKLAQPHARSIECPIEWQFISLLKVMNFITYLGSGASSSGGSVTKGPAFEPSLGAGLFSFLLTFLHWWSVFIEVHLFLCCESSKNCQALLPKVKQAQCEFIKTHRHVPNSWMLSRKLWLLNLLSTFRLIRTTALPGDRHEFESHLVSD